MNKLGCTGLHPAVSKKKKTQQDNKHHPDLIKLREQVDHLAAQRKSIISNGGSLSKIDAQLQIVEDALADAEKVNSSEKKPTPSKKKAGKKRSRIDDQSEFEDLEDIEQQTEKPSKKKRISAKDRIAMENSGESKHLEGFNVKEESTDEEVKKPTELSKKQNKSSSMKIKKKHADSEKITNIEESKKSAQSKKGRIKKEVHEEENEILNNKSRDIKKPVVVKKPIKKEDDDDEADGADTLDLKPAPLKKGRPRKKTGSSKLSD